MQQTLLPFKYESERESTGLTALAGLPVCLELMRTSGMLGLFDTHLGVRRQGKGWTDGGICGALMLLNLAGGESVSDLEVLEKDDGLRRILLQAQMFGLSRKERRKREKKFLKEQKRAVPSESATFRYLKAFHDPTQEDVRIPHTAFIPKQNSSLSGFAQVAKHWLSFVQKLSPQSTATLDMDATLIETNKSDALYCYKKFTAYQPLNVWWAEQEQMAYTEFRDGNVPAGFEQKRVLQQTLDLLPSGIERVRVRSDTAGYQTDFLTFCQNTGHARFKHIEFMIGCKIQNEFKQAAAATPDSEWKKLTREIDGRTYDTPREWAEICYVPNSLSGSKTGPTYRFIATREIIEEQHELPGMESEKVYPVPTYKQSNIRYKIRGYVTNMDWEGQKLIHWICARCGKSEEAHAILKSDLAGGRLPSNMFGANAAWWWLSVLSYNLISLMKQRVFGGTWKNRRMKSLRFNLISIPGRVISHARSLIIRINKSHPALEVLMRARERIQELVFLCT